jgi:hypothetical protein
MQDIESHTIIYLRELLATRAVDEPDVATFLACWLYEETFHGLALARFLEAAGHPIGERARPRGQEPLLKRLESVAVALLSKAWPDFCALHMTWGAINELTTLTAYRRLSKLAAHPILTELLERIMLDESRHFFFYFRQARAALLSDPAARVSRAIVDRLGPGRERRASKEGAALSGCHSSAGTRVGRCAQGRRDHPAPAGLLDRPAGRGLDRFVRRRAAARAPAARGRPGRRRERDREDRRGDRRCQGRRGRWRTKWPP